MSKLRLADLKAGMVVTADIHNFSGQLLLKEGKSLKDKDIKTLKAWGVTEVEVEGKVPGSSSRRQPNIPPQLLLEVQTETAELFRFSNTDHPIIIELMRLCTLNKLHKQPGMEEINVN